MTAADEGISISVCITTYKHEKYIKQCLESIFSQEFNGIYEIVICDDNSPDNTETIIKEIINTHPYANKIKYYKNNPNLGYVKNTLFSFAQSSGKYIAILDGDDYWIDNLKLQKQFDFLEQNKDFSASGGDSLVVYEDLNLENHSFSNHGGKILDKKDLTDLKICQTSTLFSRKSIMKDDFPTDIISADRCLYLLAGCFGKIKILPEQMSTYRQFAASISKNISYHTIKKDFAIIPFIKKYNPEYSTFKLKSYFYYTLMAYPSSISKTEFYTASLGYFVLNTLAKFSINPLKLYSAMKWNWITIKQKYHIHQHDEHFSYPNQKV